MLVFVPLTSEFQCSNSLDVFILNVIVQRPYNVRAWECINRSNVVVRHAPPLPRASDRRRMVYWVHDTDSWHLFKITNNRARIGPGSIFLSHSGMLSLVSGMHANIKDWSLDRWPWIFSWRNSMICSIDWMLAGAGWRGIGGTWLTLATSKLKNNQEI